MLCTVFPSLKNAFTLSEAMVSLVLTGTLIAISTPMILSSVQNSTENANGAKIKRMQVELANAMSTFKRRNDVNVATAGNVVENMSYSRRYTSGNVTLDAPPRNEANRANETETFTLTAGVTNAYTLPFGGTLVVESQTFANAAFADCVNAEQRALRFLYDPDSRVSGNNDSVWLYLYETDRVRSLGTLVPNTCTQNVAALNRVVGADPRGFIS
jgi:Tfp pilus assembly protein PilE